MDGDVTEGKTGADRQSTMALYNLLFICLTWITTFTKAQQCDRALTATSTSVQQPAIVGSSGQCTWTVTTDGSNVVLVRFMTVNLSNHTTCDETNSIVVYDGDASGVIMGLVCRQQIASFQSTGNTITVRYPAAEVTDPSAFTMTYSRETPERCSISVVVTALSTTEYTLVSPGYPTGSASQVCLYSIFRRSNKERILITLESGNANKTCAGVSVSIYEIGSLSNPIDGWCPGRPNEFLSWDTGLRIGFSLDPGRSIRIKYRAVEETTCPTVLLNATKDEQFLTTPGYPNPFPSFTECRWTVESPIRNGGVRFELVESDLEQNDGCTIDSLMVVSRFLGKSSRAGTTCGGEPTSIISYSPDTLVIFRSVSRSNTRRGYRLKFYHVPAEPCGGNMTANSSILSIQSPGYPVYYPRAVKCVWRITAQNPGNYVKLDFVDAQLRSCFSYTKITVYDGSSESRKIGELCDRTNSRPSIQPVQRTVTVVFLSDTDWGNIGFNMTYTEIEIINPVNRRFDARLGGADLISPRFPDGLAKNMDITWTFKPFLISYEILVVFSEVDLGDKVDCNKNYIKVFYGTTSSPLVSILCGQETGVYMSRDSLMTIVMKTDSTPTKRGFKARYSMMYDTETAGCTGEPHLITVYGNYRLNTPNYPNPYPNLANCSYILHAFLTNDFLSITIPSIEMTPTEDTSCSQDYIDLYDGNTTSSKSLGRFCRETTQTITSTGQDVLVRFITNSNLGAKGAQIHAKAERHENTYTTSYTWVWILLGVIAGIFVVVVVACLVCAYRKSDESGSAVVSGPV